MRGGKSLERGSVANGPFSSIKTEACKPPQTPDFGAFVRAQIVAQEDEPNPIGFSLPDGTKGRVWLASDRDHSKIIGDDRLWRVNTEELLRQRERRPKAISWLPTAEALRRPIIVVGRNDPVRDIDDALGRVKGFKLRICLESEKELQILGCGWRIVTCQFRGNSVLLHHNGNVATVKRKAFKELLAAIRLVRPKRRRPSLRLVVSNPMPSVAIAAAAITAADATDVTVVTVAAAVAVSVLGLATSAGVGAAVAAAADIGAGGMGTGTGAITAISPRFACQINPASTGCGGDAGTST